MRTDESESPGLEAPLTSLDSTSTTTIVMGHQPDPEFDYHRSVLGYHGCDREVGEAIILGESEFEQSDNDYDWLGSGIYFWERGRKRAWEWAEKRADDPYVVGAYIDLGRCLDLTDTLYTRTLSLFYDRFDSLYRDIKGKAPPSNKSLNKEDEDFIIRQRDCAFLNWFLQMTDESQGRPDKIEHINTLEFDPDERYFQTVRGIFTEGDEIYDGTGIYKKGHIQISVRDPSCIRGVFHPYDHEVQGGPP